MTSIDKTLSPKLEIEYETYKKDGALIVKEFTKCMNIYKTGKVTRVLSPQVVFIEVVPYHVKGFHPLLYLSKPMDDRGTV